MYQLMKTTKQKAKQIKTQNHTKNDKKTIIQTLAVLGKKRHRTKQTLEKTKRAIMNAQSRDTDYFGHTRHTKKTKKIIQPRTPPNIRRPLCY